MESQGDTGIPGSYAGDVAPEYEFDYSKAKTNRFAARAAATIETEEQRRQSERVFREGQEYFREFSATHSRLKSKRERDLRVWNAIVVVVIVSAAILALTTVVWVYKAVEDALAFLTCSPRF